MTQKALDNIKPSVLETLLSVFGGEALQARVHTRPHLRGGCNASCWRRMKREKVQVLDIEPRVPSLFSRPLQSSFFPIASPNSTINRLLPEFTDSQI